MKVNLAQPIPRPAVASYEVLSILERPADKIISAEVAIENFGTRTLTLWAGADYSALRTWTDASLKARIETLIPGTVNP